MKTKKPHQINVHWTQHAKKK